MVNWSTQLLNRRKKPVVMNHKVQLKWTHNWAPLFRHNNNQISKLINMKFPILWLQASTIDGRRKGACLFCQEYFMDLYLLAELKTISLKVRHLTNAQRRYSRRVSRNAIEQSIYSNCEWIVSFHFISLNGTRAEFLIEFPFFWVNFC